MTNYGGFAGEQLRQFIAQIEKLEQEKTDIAENIREAFAAAKAEGFDPKIMRKVLRIRKMEPEKYFEEEELLDIYKHALGMSSEAPQEKAA